MVLHTLMVTTTIEIDSTDDEYQIDTNDSSFKCTPEKTLLNESMKNLDE